MKFTTGAAIDPEARYLDYERVIRELAEAERDHKLDAVGVIENLKEAVNTCRAAADRYTVRATESRRAGDAYVIARGKYLAEIKRRVELPRGKQGAELRTPARPGWERWCLNNGLSVSDTYNFLAAARGDMAKINKRRREQRKYYHQRCVQGSHDWYLAQIRKLWTYLTPAEREEFIREALSFKDYAPPDNPVAKTVAYQQSEHQAVNA